MTGGFARRLAPAQGRLPAPAQDAVDSCVLAHEEQSPAIGSAHMMIHIRQGEGSKNCDVPFSSTLVAQLCRPALAAAPSHHAALPGLQVRLIQRFRTLRRMTW
jgi:hypothetical protein